MDTWKLQVNGREFQSNVDTNTVIELHHSMKLLTAEIDCIDPDSDDFVCRAAALLAEHLNAPLYISFAACATVRVNTFRQQIKRNAPFRIFVETAAPALLAQLTGTSEESLRSSQESLRSSKVTLRTADYIAKIERYSFIPKKCLDSVLALIVVFRSLSLEICSHPLKLRDYVLHAARTLAAAQVTCCRSESFLSMSLQRGEARVSCKIEFDQ